MVLSSFASHPTHLKYSAARVHPPLPTPSASWGRRSVVLRLRGRRSARRAPSSAVGVGSVPVVAASVSSIVVPVASPRYRVLGRFLVYQSPQFPVEPFQSTHDNVHRTHKGDRCLAGPYFRGDYVACYPVELTGHLIRHPRYLLRPILLIHVRVEKELNSIHPIGLHVS